RRLNARMLAGDGVIGELDLAFLIAAEGEREVRQRETLTHPRTGRIDLDDAGVLSVFRDHAPGRSNPGIRDQGHELAFPGGSGAVKGDSARGSLAHKSIAGQGFEYHRATDGNAMSSGATQSGSEAAIGRGKTWQVPGVRGGQKLFPPRTG